MTAAPDASDAAGFAGTTYVPPRSPEDDHPLWLALKVGLSMFLADLIASTIGFQAPTWSIILAAYLSTQPPQSSAGAAGRKLLAMVGGVALGVGSGYVHQFVPNQGVALTFAGLGLIAGVLATRSADYVFAAVVATVITFVAQTGEETVLVEGLRAAAMIVIGCLVAPAVVWSVERVRAWRHERGA